MSCFLTIPNESRQLLRYACSYFCIFAHLIIFRIVCKDCNFYIMRFVSYISFSTHCKNCCKNCLPERRWILSTYQIYTLTHLHTYISKESLKLYKIFNILFYVWAIKKCCYFFYVGFICFPYICVLRV